jgi:hypothetical protein
MPNLNQRMSFFYMRLTVTRGASCLIAFLFLPYLCLTKAFPNRVARIALNVQITSHDDFSTAAPIVTKAAKEFDELIRSRGREFGFVDLFEPENLDRQDS